MEFFFFLALESLRHEDHKFKSILNYIGIPCLNKIILDRLLRRTRDFKLLGHVGSYP